LTDFCGLTPTPFYFLRHGETDWNAQGLSQGTTDVRLNDTGRQQARDSAALLARQGITQIFASPLSRAAETARLVAATLGVTITTDPDLREASFGVQEGLPMGTWYDDWVTGTYTPVGADIFATLRRRAVTAVNRAVTTPGPILIIAHGAFFRAVRAEMGLDARVRTANGVPLLCAPGEPAWSLTPLAD
jgi:probable phosphoglycerate mutase